MSAKRERDFERQLEVIKYKPSYTCMQTQSSAKLTNDQCALSK